MLEAVRWLFVALAVACIVAVLLLDLRSGAALTLFFLFLLFGAFAAMLSLELPFPWLLRKKRW